MNNGKYILVAEEFLPEDFKVESIRVEYKKSAILGDRLHPVVYNKEEDVVTVALTDDEKKPYAVVEFKRKKEC